MSQPTTTDETQTRTEPRCIAPSVDLIFGQKMCPLPAPALPVIRYALRRLPAIQEVIAVDCIELLAMTLLDVHSERETWRDMALASIEQQRDRDVENARLHVRLRERAHA